MTSISQRLRVISGFYKGVEGTVIEKKIGTYFTEYIIEFSTKSGIERAVVYERDVELLT